MSPHCVLHEGGVFVHFYTRTVSLIHLVVWPTTTMNNNRPQPTSTYRRTGQIKVLIIKDHSYNKLSLCGSLFSLKVNVPPPVLSVSSSQFLVLSLHPSLLSHPSVLWISECERTKTCPLPGVAAWLMFPGFSVVSHSHLMSWPIN